MRLLAFILYPRIFFWNNSNFGKNGWNSQFCSLKKVVFEIGRTSIIKPGQIEYFVSFSTWPQQTYLSSQAGLRCLRFQRICNSLTDVDDYTHPCDDLVWEQNWYISCCKQWTFIKPSKFMKLPWNNEILFIHH